MPLMSSATSSNHELFEKLTENMQAIYRKAIDADELLAKIQQSGKGKFNHVFTEDAGFSTQSKRFMPYVEELAEYIVKLQDANQQRLQSELPQVIKKMELLLTTLRQFKTAVWW